MLLLLIGRCFPSRKPPDIKRCFSFPISSHPIPSHLTSVLFYSLSIDVDDIMTSSKETLNHPTIIPLANLISRELLALKYALKMESLRQFGLGFESTVSNLLDFRTAQAAWEGQPSGHVRK